jgi:rubrerythrin
MSNTTDQNLSNPRSTNTSNKHYDLVSILYHALEGAQTYARYVEDAGQEGDQELAQFFLQVQQEENNRAERAKQLLAKRINQ